MNRLTINNCVIGTDLHYPQTTKLRRKKNIAKSKAMPHLLPNHPSMWIGFRDLCHVSNEGYNFPWADFYNFYIICILGWQKEAHVMIPLKLSFRRTILPFL